MNRILIVDDDALSRDKLRSLIDYEKSGYIIIGEAKSGREAIGLIKRLEPDIVVTDIHMQNINGIELIEFIGENYPSISVIALSAYDDYRYVRDGLKLGAKDYLLKHTLTSESLLKVLDEISNPKQSAIEEQGDYYAERKGFIRQLLLDKPNMSAETNKLIQKYKLNPDSGLICVAFSYNLPETTVENNSSQSKSYFSKMIDNILEGVLPDFSKAELIRIDDGEALILFDFENCNSMKSIQQEVNNYLQIIRRKIALLFDGEMSFGVSGLFFGIEKYSKAYSEASANLKMKFFYPKASVFRMSKNRDDTPIQLDNEQKLMLQNYVMQGDLVLYSEQIDLIFTDIKNRHSKFTCIQYFCYMLLGALEDITKKNIIEVEPPYDLNQLPFTKEETECDLEEIQNWFLRIGRKIMNLLSKQIISSSYSDVTKGALLYIKKHFQDNISLKDVAEHISFNASYLSRIFKEDTGISLVNYINKYRIERAIEIMKSTTVTSRTLAVIANEVGFNAYNQFLVNFKKEMNCTPEIYWERIR